MIIIVANHSEIDHSGILFSTAAILEMIRGLEFKDKKAAAFGRYGWGGESVKIITEWLKKACFEIIDDEIRELRKPDKKGRFKLIVKIKKCLNLVNLNISVDRRRGVKSTAFY
ncbi:flavorubredoxin [Clostridium acetobutylicum]|nr:MULTISPECIES: flavoprotein [Clostridium]ADZ20551.1 flavoprotein [Clostridium acetobutylicum EA 2018]NOV90325.1 flavorubredoxin [Clostridium acetobutylicum]NOW15149.1 flavorubredoxin [Clostridium acetobutylicum]NRY56829.1 flavorubredoxin [Clostridium acetobutylicum]NSA93575.1 flavorubredoxin [Clostridium acetobutylicum]